MSVQIIINGENAKESLLELSTLAAGFGQALPVISAAPLAQEAAPAQASIQQTTAVSTKDGPVTSKKEVKQKAAVKETPNQEAAQEQEETVTSITIEELRALAQEKNKSVGSAAVREVLGKYGGLPKAKPEQYDQIKQELESL